MRNYFKSSIYLVALIGYSLVCAGSYEDFFTAIKRDDPEAVQTLLRRGFDPNTLDPQRIPGLYLALREPSPKVAGVLIDWPQTRIEIRTEQDESPLMIACLKGQLDMVKKLIARGADINKTGWTPLHYAATSGHIAIMELLLEQHAYIDAESPNGTTPLMMAANYGTLEAVKLLLREGADPALKNQLGLSAIDFAFQVSRKEVADLIAASMRSTQIKGKW